MHLHVRQKSITVQRLPNLFSGHPFGPDSHQFPNGVLHLFILLTIVGLIYPTYVFANDLNFEKRTHFIVLIRDTPEMYDISNHQERIKETFPRLLFQGDDRISSREKQDVPLPVYQPDDDYISVVFTSVGGCQNSLSPEKLFRGESFKQFPNENKFGNFLDNLITARKTDKCHGKEFATTFAQQTILPYMQDQLQRLNTKTLRFSDTFLVEINNDIRTPIGYEEANLRKQQINDIDKAKSLVDSTSSYFSTDLDWIFKVSNQKDKRGAYEIHRGTASLPQGNPITYKIYKINPKINIGNYIENYKPEIRLDRVAISQEKLRLIDEQRGKEVELSLRTDSKVVPEALLLKFIGQENSAWQVGQYTFPISKLIDLTSCKGCVQENGVIQVPLLEATRGEEVFLKPNDKPLLPVTVHFKVRFRYNAENVYTYSYIDSEEQTIKIQPVELITIKDNLFGEVILDNRGLASQFESNKDSENGLTQNKARDRISATWDEKRESELAKQHLVETLSRIYWIIAALIVFVMIWFWLYKRFYHRRFDPGLEWQPADEIMVNFNQQVGSRLLVGTLLFKNRGVIPWFGRLPLINNQVYPDYNLKFSLSYSKDELQQYGLDLTEDEPFGFMGVGQPSSPISKLVREMEYRVSNNTPIYLFLATEEIQDISAAYSQALDFAQEDSPAIVVNMQWEGGSQQLPRLPFKVDLIPEQPKLPEITYLGKTEKCNFSKGDFVPIGKLRFISKATHQFAQPFEEEFKVLSYKNGLLLPEEAVKVKGGDKIQVPPGQTVEVEVGIFCDGATVSNPEPPSQEYSFDLIGDFAATSQRGPYHFTLYRDPTPADIHLEIIQLKNIHRLYWEHNQGHPIHKLGQQRGTFQREGTLLRDDQLRLEPHVITFRKGTSAPILFEIKIGNTGKSGNGYVKAVLDMSLQFKGNVLDSLTFNQSGNQEDLLHLSSGSVTGVYQSPVPFKINEGDAPKQVAVELHPNVIEDIRGGRTPDNQQIEVTATLAITIEDGQGHQRQHQLSIVAGIGLEKLPGDNWICIDFGTSAIAVATGTWRNYQLLPLQKLVSKQKDDSLNIADFDIHNSERDTEFFLPSYIACDADLRQGKAETDKVRKGFPSFSPASLKPGDPDFVSLPATSTKLMEHPGRIVYSLKSWFAQLSQTISLQESIDIKESNGREVKRAQLLLEDLVQSGLAALAEAYITYFSRDNGFEEEDGGFAKGGQLVLSCPNTFTSFHRQKFQEIAWKALNGPLGIGMPKHISLISESDAVAYYHCQQRLKQNKHRTGTERLLVYDFGAGTLDLSLVNITWNKDGTYPEKWEVENRLGVPIAGNYLDSRLACLIDKLLKDKSVLRDVFEYRYPVVVKNKKLAGSDSDKLNHRNAIYHLWQGIRAVKHHWNGQEDFTVRVGSSGSSTEVVRRTDNPDDNAVDLQKPRLTVDGNSYFLSIPATTVHDYVKEFIEFVTATVIDELLSVVHLQPSQIDTVIVSGRGALWPGLRERVWNKFPHISNEDREVKPDFVTDSNQAKNVVVHGAIAWQALSPQKGKAIEAKVAPRLAILRNQTQQLTFEEEWQDGKQPIDLNADLTFQLMQVFLKNPNPKKDFDSLRRYFYVKVGGEIQRNYRWSADSLLFVCKTEQEGQIEVSFKNSQGESVNPMTMESRHSTLLPPWPIGDVCLSPSECL